MAWRLYVVPGERNSAKALRLCPASVTVVDVRDLDDRPPFLDGVPVVANSELMTAYKGTRCLEMLQTMRGSDAQETRTAAPEPQPVAPEPQPVATGAAVSSFLDGAPVNGAGVSVDTPFVTEDVNQDDPLPAVDVTAYMSQRDAAVDQIRAQAGTKK